MSKRADEKTKGCAIALSACAKALWAKTPQSFFGAVRTDDMWLPLYKHMRDSAEIAKLLWEHWISLSVKSMIDNDPDTAKSIFVFLAAAHDIGKATPEFQAKDEALKRRAEANGLPFKKMSPPRRVPHNIAGQAVLQDFLREAPRSFGKDEAKTFGVVIGGHHGVSPETILFNDISAWDSHTGFGMKEWRNVQKELTDFAVCLSGIDLERIGVRTLSIPAQVMLTGLVIMTDWLASDEDLFPYESPLFPRDKTSEDYAGKAWEELGFSQKWTMASKGDGFSPAEFFRSRFLFSGTAEVDPRPLQTAALAFAQGLRKPGIMVIEAPMGEGKTEAALLAAEVMAAITSRSGLFFALPTQATTDGLFPRIIDWIDTLNKGNYSITLAHGKAKFNEQYAGLANLSKGVNLYEEEYYDDEKADSKQSSVVAHEWFQGRKKGMLADFVVGTVDQVLMAALKQRHLMLRHLGLADKVVVIDECHAYDAYMSQYLERALQWLGAYGVPVVILSATLPIQKRKDVINAYLGHKQAHSLGNAEKNEERIFGGLTYPLISYSDGEEIFFKEVAAAGRNIEVALDFLTKEEEENLPQIVEELLSGGGCVGIIRNTVKRSREIATVLADRFGESNVELFHSQFLSTERIKKEKLLRKNLGPGKLRPHKYIVVGTQVLEQSLDIDFDLLITDAAPVDLLLQRMGRLHRHKREDRPEKLRRARCLVTGAWQDGGLPEFEQGSEAIYGRYLLEGTFARLRELSAVRLPEDIPVLVQDVYRAEGPEAPEAWREDLCAARTKHEERIHDKIIKAREFRIRDVKESENLLGWLSTPVRDKTSRGEATVRDTSDSLEVIVVQRTSGGEMKMLPWIEYGDGESDGFIPTDYTPDDDLAEKVAGCTVNLPMALCVPWRIDRVITELESGVLRDIVRWQDSGWLKGALILALDDNFEAQLCGYRLKYTEKWGLSAEKTGKDDDGKEV